MQLKNTELDVAYFSMEIMMESEIPSYAGGLGVLAGDILRSCADKEIPSIGVSLVYSGAIYSQRILPDGTQSFIESDWRNMDRFVKLPHRITLRLKGEDILVSCWRYDIVGLHGFVVPIYLLDTNMLENPAWARDITMHLYDDNWTNRFCQEVLLGVGGVKMLKEIGYHKIKTYHMNEGHCAMVPLALLEDHDYKNEPVRAKCVFTTHTPIPEGHDKFSYELAHEYADSYIPWHIKDLATSEALSMSHLAINMSKITFAVSKKHQKVTEHLFPNHTISSVTNGVHHRSWIGHHQQDLYQKYMPGFLDDPALLEGSDRIPDDDLWTYKQAAKEELLEYVNKHLIALGPSNAFEPDTLTIAMARRPVPYKRPLLLYKDIERLTRLGKNKIQIIQCGKGHPKDKGAHDIIDEIIQLSKKLNGTIRVDYLENYSPKIARLLVAGTDIWLNTPIPPLEASGTSGMKAAMNATMNVSIADGWWIEAIEQKPDSGFVIGDPYDDVIAPKNMDVRTDRDADSLYGLLEKAIIPMYYENRSEWIRRMKEAITLGAYFNTHRCAEEYRTKGWLV